MNSPGSLHGMSPHSATDDPRNRNIKIYINGELYPRDDAKISVYDTGFLLGDGAWED